MSEKKQTNDDLSQISQAEHDLTWLKYMVKLQERRMTELKAEEDPTLTEEICKLKRYKSRNERFIKYTKFYKKQLSNGGL